jgi:SAM-dependent methyltransferase
MSIPYSDILADYYAGKSPPIQQYPTFLHEYLEIENVVGDGYKILDYGCGSGNVFIQFLQALPFDIEYVGIDPDPSLKGKVSFPLYSSLEEFLEAGYESRYFDGLFMLDFIEHVPLDEGYRILTTVNKFIDGDIVIMTPNSKALDYVLNDPQHVAIYPAHWLKGLVEHLGFEHVEIKRGKGIHRVREIEYNKDRQKNAQYKEFNDLQEKVCMAMGLDWYGNLLVIGSRDEDSPT